MEHLATKISNFFNQIPGRVYLLLAIAIFAASNSVVRKLTEIGAQNLIDGRNPISFCNVMFAGNVCASIVLILIYHQQWKIDSIKQLSWKDWLSLIAVALLSGAIAPSLTFMSLSMTNVNNVVLIGRIEPLLVLTLSVLLLRERMNRWVFAGAVVSFMGAILTILLQKPEQNMVEMGAGLTLGKGELMAAGGAIALAFSTIISKIKLRQIPLGIFTIFRTGTGLIIFFAIALKLFGPVHFMDSFSPLLWQLMLVYGAVIVVGGQLCWFRGLKTSGASEVSLASSFSPIAGILAAYLILREAPNMAQYMGGSFIVGGIVLNQIVVWRKSAESTAAPKVISAKELEMGVGFKGV